MKSVVLLSGGLDSTVCMALHEHATGLFVDYRQPHLRQEFAAARHVMDTISRPLLTAEVRLPTQIDSEDPAMLIPGRNLILLSLAATIADHVVFGANADDYDGYPDCRPEFFAAAEPALGVKIETPLLYMSKQQIGDLAHKLGVPVEYTWSCYYPEGDRPCGECDACKHRAEALW